MPLPLRSPDRFRRDVPRLAGTSLPRTTLCLRALLAGCLTLGGAAAPAHAQGYPFSQRGSVTQHVAHTTIAVEYGRPVARGRALFGQLVPWDSVWHPGADSATRISFDHPVRLEGQDVRAGEYSLWLIPRASAPWTVILSRAAHVFHKPYPGPSRDAYRFDVSPERSAHMESLAIYFPSVLRADAVLRIHWGESVLPIRVSAPYSPP
jgi:hypothetical protein